MKSISESRGKHVSTSEMAHILTAYNEKYGINQIDFDDMSYDSPSEAAQLMTYGAMESYPKMLNEPRKIDLDDESSFDFDTFNFYF